MGLILLMPNLIYASNDNTSLSDAILAFDGATCPAGWVEVSSNAGRVVLGAGSGNLDSTGASLTARTLGQTGGLEYTTGYPASTSTAVNPTPDPSLVFCSMNGTNTFYVNAGVSGISVNSGANGGPTVSTNLPPYTTVTFCRIGP